MNCKEFVAGLHNGVHINDLYDKIILLDPSKFESFEEFSKTIEFLVSYYVQYNDFLHSNNLLQVFYSCCNFKSIDINIYDWYQYYSIKIYSKRSIKYYLDNPKKFWDTVYSLSGNTNSNYFEKLDGLLIDTIEFYKKEYVKYPIFLKSSIEKFIKYYKEINKYSDSINFHIYELENLCSTDNKCEVEKIYAGLESRNIKEIEIPENIYLESKEYKNYLDDISREEQKEEKYYGDIYVEDDDHDKKIIIMGDDPFVHNKNVIFGIAKKYNILKDQFEFYTDYDKIKKKGQKVIDKTWYNGDKYIGIIFGSVPHKTEGNDDYTSLITRVIEEPGFPYAVVCKVESLNGRIKITKTSFTNALRELIINYVSVKKTSEL